MKNIWRFELIPASKTRKLSPYCIYHNCYAYILSVNPYRHFQVDMNLFLNPESLKISHFRINQSSKPNIFGFFYLYNFDKSLI